MGLGCEINQFHLIAYVCVRSELVLILLVPWSEHQMYIYFCTYFVISRDLEDLQHLLKTNKPSGVKQGVPTSNGQYIIP